MKYSKDEISKLLIEFYENNGRSAKRDEIKSIDETLCRSNVEKVFEKSWNGILKELNLPLNFSRKTLKGFSKKDLLNIFKNDFTEITNFLGRNPLRNEFTKYKKGFGVNTYTHNLNMTWTDLVLSVGISKFDKRGANISKEDIDKYIIELVNKNGKAPTINEISPKVALIIRTKLKLKWNEYLKTIDVKINLEMNKRILEKDEMIKELYNLYKKLEEPPTQIDCRMAFKNGIIKCSPPMYIHTFGSWNVALRMAGIPIKRDNKLKYNKRDIREGLLKLSKEVKGRPIYIDINTCKYLPSCNTISNYFSTTVSKILDEIVGS